MYKKLNFPSTSGYVAYLLKLQGGPSQNCPVEQINPKNILNLRVGVLIFFSFIRFIHFSIQFFFSYFGGLLSLVCLFTVKHIAKDF